jgi:hypothetical protein
MGNLVRWSLLEFSPVGEGYINRGSFQLDREFFRAATERAGSTFSDPSKIDVYQAEAKAGTYALITPAGNMYGTAAPTLDGVFPTVGSILHEHLSVLADKLPFSKALHLQRYGKYSITGKQK